MKYAFCALVLCLLPSFYLHSQQLTAILHNPPGSDEGLETVQISGTAGQSLSGLYFIEIEGDAVASGLVGTIDQAVDLGSLSPNTLGANGLFLIRDAATSIPPGPDPATQVAVFNFSPNLENGSSTFLLVQGFTGSVGDDLDTDNDGTLDQTPWNSVLSAVAVLSAGTHPEYATAFGGEVVTSVGCGFSPPFTPGFIFQAPGGWAGALPLTGAGGTLVYDASRVVQSDCSNLSATYGGEVILLGGEGFLPVTWANWTAFRHGRTVTLEWSTLAETNNAYFSIERSEDNGRSFASLGEIAAAHEGEGLPQDYRYLDTNAPSGTLLYRIRQTDFDNRFSFSPFMRLAATSTANNTYFEVYPTVSTGWFTLVTDFSAIASLRVSDFTGRQFFAFDSQAISNQLDLSVLPGGWYLIQVKMQDGREMSKRVYRQ